MLLWINSARLGQHAQVCQVRPGSSKVELLQQNLYRPDATSSINTIIDAADDSLLALNQGRFLAQKFWGIALSSQPLHYRVHFIRSPKPKKFKIGLHFPASFWFWGQQVNLRGALPHAPT